MSTYLARIAAATTLALLATNAVALAQTRPSIRDAAARVSFVQSPPPMTQKDSNKNGTAIGALVGGGAMATLIAVLWNRCGEGCENDMEAWAPFAAVGMGAAGGAAVGYFIDKAHRGTRKVVVAPTVTRRERGVRLAVRF